MSALGQKQTFAPQNVMSPLHPKADMCIATAHVCYGPKADIAQRPSMLALAIFFQHSKRATQLIRRGLALIVRHAVDLELQPQMRCTGLV
jgi:hypothetical protein